MNPNCPHYRLLNVMLPKTVLMMFSGAIWWRRVFMCPKTWIWAAAKSNCGELWIPGANREFATAFVLIIVSVFYAAIFAAGAFEKCTNHDSTEHSWWTYATYWHLYLSLCPPYNCRKILQLFIFSLFLGPLYGWGKFVKFEYGCTIAFFDSSANGRWAKNLFSFSFSLLYKTCWHLMLIQSDIISEATWFQLS